MERRNAWKDYTKKELKEMEKLCEDYRHFLDDGKTERECVKKAVELLKAAGYAEFDTKGSYQPGDKVYYVNRRKAIIATTFGKKPLSEGLHINGAHIDSPRLDLKPNPLYEEGGFAYFKTHYYGGIKKYQWTTIPLSIHGVVVKANGEKIYVNVGDDEKDPVFTITDLLPHLAQEQMEKKLKEGISGEDLNLLIGSIPYNAETTERVKLNILNILNKKYGITEIDFLSSELEIVPALKCRTMGFDESMVAGYGQDDKICVYTSLTALVDMKEIPEKTSVCIIADKEEIGSMGNTGMESHVFDNFIAELLNKLGINRPNLLDKVFCHSKMLSADVDAGLDPIYANVSEKNNASYLGRGIGLNKYTGSRGKSGASDANAEFVAEVRNILEKENIKYQIAELGKVDTGGGGTIAYILANKGIDVIDCGVPVLSMHSPYEVTSKIDLYEAYRAYKAFWLN